MSADVVVVVVADLVCFSQTGLSMSAMRVDNVGYCWLVRSLSWSALADEVGKVARGNWSSHDSLATLGREPDLRFDCAEGGVPSVNIHPFF